MAFKTNMKAAGADIKAIGHSALKGVGAGIKIGVAFLPITIAIYVINRI